MLSTRNSTSKVVLALILLAFMGMAAFLRPVPHYPNVSLTAPENVQINLLINPAPDIKACLQTLSTLVDAFEATCPACRIRKQQCLEKLTPREKALLSSAPLPLPSAHMANGVTTFEATDPAVALAACRESERQSARGSGKITCHAPNTLRPMLQPVKHGWANNLLTIILTLAAAGAASWFICYLIIRYEHLHAHLSHDHTDAGPQKFHALPTPRIGGLGLFGGLIMGAGAILILRPEHSPTANNFGYLLLAALPVWLGGLMEDITKNVGVVQRLLLTMISAAIAVWLLGAVVNRLDIPLMDDLLRWLPAAIVFTVFAAGGVTNALNIIDGYNGLAAGFSVIVLIAIAAVASQLNDNLVLTASISMIGATLGFMVWNWPRGEVFMGDGGAYLLGFILAELSVLLVYRNPSVSPWFPLLLLAYPVFETLFSIYRRKWLRNSTPGHPDALHMHQIIFKRIVRGHIHNRCHLTGCDNQQANGRCFHRITANNSRVAPYLWASASLCALFAVKFWQQTSILILASIVGCTAYVLLYRRLTKLKRSGKLVKQG